MSIFDIVIIALLIFALVRGAILGIFRQLGVLVGVVLALLFTGILSTLFSDLVYSITSGATRLEGTLYYSIMFVAIVLITYLISILLHKTSKVLKIGWIDRLLGAAFGGLKLLMIVGIVLHIYIGIYKGIYNQPPTPLEGVTYTPIVDSVSAIMKFVTDHGITFGY